MEPNRIEKSELLEMFWVVYDEYLFTQDRLLRPRLSNLLEKIEIRSRVGQLLRPERGWNTILAWQLLSNQDFIFNTERTPLDEGEILLWSPFWNRDVLLTKHSFENNYNDFTLGWNQIVFQNYIADEKGLYLPLFDYGDVMKLVNQQRLNIKL